MAMSARVVSIEPIEYHQKLVTLRDNDGNEYTLRYGDSITEDAIRRRAPMIVSKKDKKRRESV